MYHLDEKRIDLPEKILVELQKMGRKFELSQIILFGSRARCTNGERSDIDLAIYAKDVLFPMTFVTRLKGTGWSYMKKFEQLKRLYKTMTG